MRPDNPIRNLDPRKLARYEKENYVAYYQKDWLKLLRVSVGMVKESFGLSLPQAIYGAESDKFKEAAYYRALGMLYSDLWVNEGKPAGSPLLVKEEQALYQGYKALKEAINN